MAPSDTISHGAESNSSVPTWSGGKEQGDVWKDAVESIHGGCCGKDIPPWMDWVESGIEFFGCEGEAPDGKSVNGRALMLQDKSERVERDDRDYARLHEEFFESLLKEQVQMQNALRKDVVPALNACDSKDDSINSGVTLPSFASSASSVTYENESLSSTKTLKRRRPLKLSPRRKLNSRVAPIEAYNRKYNPALQDQISLETIAEKELPNPFSFIHSDCVMQKDKGKGDSLGASISAEGRDACLDKLREKMAIVIQVSGEATGIKRRIGKVSENALGYIETRSMLELRLGFLSMQYGLLLRWDSHRTGKIVFIVLRKMCHDSFYSKIPPILEHSPHTQTTITNTQLEAPPLVVRNLIGSHAIYQRILGTEVVLVNPPYLVPQPEVFIPSILSVQINQVHGLSKKSRWTISITFNGHTEMTLLHYNHDKLVFETKRPAMEWEMTPVTSFDLASLEIRLFEQQKRKNSHSRLASTMTMPLGGLVAQPSTSQATSWQLTMPFTHNPKANFALSLVHQSDYSHWLYKELDARRTEEHTQEVVSSWKAPFRKKQNKTPRSSEDIPDVWDWLCGVCFKEYYLPVDFR